MRKLRKSFHFTQAWTFPGSVFPQFRMAKSTTNRQLTPFKDTTIIP